MVTDGSGQWLGGRYCYDGCLCQAYTIQTCCTKLLTKISRNNDTDICRVVPITPLAVALSGCVVPNIRDREHTTRCDLVNLGQYTVLITVISFFIT